MVVKRGWYGREVAIGGLYCLSGNGSSLRGTNEQGEENRRESGRPPAFAGHQVFTEWLTIIEVLAVIFGGGVWAVHALFEYT